MLFQQPPAPLLQSDPLLRVTGRPTEQEHFDHPEHKIADHVTFKTGQDSNLKLYFIFVF